MSAETTPSPPPAGSSPDGGASGQRQLNEIRRVDRVQGKPDRTFPDYVSQHYHQDGNSFRSAYLPDKIEFVDRGNRMHAYRPVSRFTQRTLVETAQARGWKELEVTGGERFRQAIYIEAASRGVPVRGYTPTEQDADILQRRAERKAAESNPMVQAYLDAETDPQRKAAIKQYPQLKQAFAGDAAAKAFADANIDSKKAATNFVNRFRDNTAIALHTGRELPKIKPSAEKHEVQEPKLKDQDRSR